MYYIFKLLNKELQFFLGVKYLTPSREELASKT